MRKQTPMSFRPRFGRPTRRLVWTLAFLGTPMLNGCLTAPTPGASFDPLRESVDASRTLNVERPAGASTGEKVAWYIPDRLLDFLDMFEIQLGVGPGVALDLHVTALLDGGYNYYDAYKFGLQGREFGLFRERHLNEWNLYTMGSIDHRASLTSLVGNISTFEDPSPGVRSVVRRQPHPADATITLHALVAGARLGFSFYELVDFLGGWVTWDPAADDLGAKWVEVSELDPPFRTLDRFLQALDNLDFLALKANLVSELWRNTWLKTAEGEVYSGRKFLEQRSLGQTPDGLVTEPGLMDDVNVGSIGIDTVVIEPDQYRDPIDQSFRARFQIQRIGLRRGIPEYFEGTIIATNSQTRQTETYKVLLRVEGSAWKIGRLRRVIS